VPQPRPRPHRRVVLVAHPPAVPPPSRTPRPITPTFRFRFANNPWRLNCLLQEDHSDYDGASAEYLPDENDGDPGWLHDYVLSLSASPPSSSSSSPRHEEGGVNGGRPSKRSRLTSSGVVDEVRHRD
jgi:hypothetical protein